MRRDQTRASRRGTPRRARGRAASVTSVAADETPGDEIAVEATESRGGDAPRVLPDRADAVAPISAASSGSPSSLRDERGVRRRVAIVDEESGLAVVDERPQPADRRPRRPAFRTRRLRARRDRTTRRATERCTRRRRGSSRRAASCGCGRHELHVGGDAELVREHVRHAPARRRRRDRWGRRPRAASRRGRRARRGSGTARPTPLSGWMRPDEQQHAAAVETEPVLGASSRRPGRTPSGRRRAAPPRCAPAPRRRASRADRVRRRWTRASDRSTRSRRARRARARSGSSSMPASALTRASVWNVATIGRSSAVLELVRDRARQPVVGVQHLDRRRRVEHAVVVSSMNASTSPGSS